MRSLRLTRTNHPSRVHPAPSGGSARSSPSTYHRASPLSSRQRNVVAVPTKVPPHPPKLQQHTSRSKSKPPPKASSTLLQCLAPTLLVLVLLAHPLLAWLHEVAASASSDNSPEQTATSFSTSLTHILADIEVQHAATTSLLSTHQSLATFQAIQPLSPTYTTEWAPRVLHADVAQFESDAVAQVGSPTWGLSTASISTTGTYADYYPVLYAHPPSLARFLVDTRPSLASNATTTTSTASTTSLSTVTRHSSTDAILGVTTTTVNWATLIATSLHITISSPTTTLFTSPTTTSPTTTTTTTTIPFGSDQLTLNIYSPTTSNPPSTLVIYATVFPVLALALVAVIAKLVHSHIARLKTSSAAAVDQTQQTKRFLSFVTHELRNPLFAVLGTAGELRDTVEEELTPEHHKQLLPMVDIIDTACDRMTNIVNDVLSMRKLEEGKLELDLTVISVRTVIRELVIMFRHRANESSITLQASVDDDVPSSVLADEGRIVQMLSNLVSNALKFTPANGTVTLSVSCDGIARNGGGSELTTLCFSVTDTGCGISDSALDRIFEPYVQASADVERKHGGTGLGLSIVRMMSRAMGGEVSATSTPGAGSTFFIDLSLPVVKRIPRARSSAALANVVCESPRSCSDSMVRKRPLFTLPSKPAGGRLSPERSQGDVAVLVATAAGLNRHLLTSALEQAFPGVRVDAVANGAEAVSATRARQYDMVLLETNMAVMNGQQAVASMRADGFTKPVVAITSTRRGQASLNDNLDGFTDTLCKPFKKSKVLALTRRHLGLGRQVLVPSFPTSPAASSDDTGTGDGASVAATNCSDPT